MATGTFSPTTATIVSGPTEAVLIDAQYLKDDIRDLGDLIERTGKKLTTIYVTHAHPDHYGGIGPLMERFPEAKCVALPHVVDAMKENREEHRQQWAMMFGDACVVTDALPDPITDDTLYVDGSPLKIIEVKQADIHPTSIVHIPAIDVVVAGDAVYNEIHPMLGLSTPDEWQDWLETVDLVEKLNPRMIVAGHRRPDGDDHAVDTMIAQPRIHPGFRGRLRGRKGRRRPDGHHDGEVPPSRQLLVAVVLRHECHWASQHEKVNGRPRSTMTTEQHAQLPKTAADGAVTVEKNDDNVLLIGIDRPAKRNALTPELMTRLGEVSSPTSPTTRCAAPCCSGMDPCSAPALISISLKTLWIATMLALHTSIPFRWQDRRCPSRW